MAEPGRLRVTVMYSPKPREVRERVLEVAAGSTVLQVLDAAGLLREHPELARRDAAFGIWGRRARPQDAVRDGDRVEAWRALKVDPMTARRERFSRQGARGTGLFAKRRPGAKPGY